MKHIELPLSTIVNGREWKLFSLEYETLDGKFSIWIYAINHEHAEYILEELKQTAKIGGIIVDAGKL